MSATTFTITNARSYISPVEYLYCLGAVNTLTFSADCNTATGTFVNEDGTAGPETLTRADPVKDLGIDCPDTITPLEEYQPGHFCGDPINLTTGNVAETVVDHHGAPSSPLEFRRHYNSLDGSPYNRLGNGWSHDYEAQMLVLTPTVVQAVRGSRKGITFNLVEGQFIGDADVIAQLSMQVDGSGYTQSWRYTTGNNTIETYSADGRLIAIADVRGATQSLAYSPGGGLLTSISDMFGRQLILSYDARNRLAAVTEPNGGSYSYSYDYLGNMVSAGQPGGTSTVYVRENVSYPNFLTGLIDENGKRFVTWSYDANGRGTSSQQPSGVNLTTVAYDSPTPSYVTATDALGRAQTFSYAKIENISHTASVDMAGSGFPLKANWTYFGDGSISTYTDYLGNMTCYGYGRPGLETVRVEGLPYAPDACPNLSLYPQPANGRITSTAWHPQWRLKTKVAQPKKLTTNVYNGQPDPFNGNAAASCAPVAATLPDGSPIAALCKHVEQATTDANGNQGLTPALDSTVAQRSWSYTYNQYGQMLTSTDPRGNATTFIYYPSTTVDHTAGDLQSVTNAVGHVTQFTKYDRAGRQLQSIGPTGATTVVAYLPRGWVSSVSVTPAGGGTAQVTSYTYDPAGQLKVATMPDGTAITYTYDDAHRLTSISDAAGNSVTYALDLVGNRTGEQRKDPGGALTRNITRVFDGLNQLQSVTGAAQ